MEHDRLFDGEIKRTADRSRVSWASKPSELKQRPNIVMIVLDDVGYSQFGCYGSDIETPDAGALMIVGSVRPAFRTRGGRFGGWSLFILGNRRHYTTNNFGECCRVSSPVAIPPGAVTVRADVVRTGTDEGRVRFYIGDQPLTPFRYHNFVNEPLDVGRDSQTRVDDLYESPFVFEGRIVDVVIEAFGSEVLHQETLLEELIATQ